MRTIARMSVLIGAGLVTGAMLGAGPALAAQAPPAPHNQDTVVGYFDSQSDCEWVGRIGEMQNRWDDHNCDRADRQYRGMWELSVDSNNNGNNDDNNNPWDNDDQNGQNGHNGHGGNDDNGGGNHHGHGGHGGGGGGN